MKAQLRCASAMDFTAEKICCSAAQRIFLLHRFAAEQPTGFFQLQNFAAGKRFFRCAALCFPLTQHNWHSVAHSSIDQLHSAQLTFPPSKSTQKIFKQNSHRPQLLPSENNNHIGQLLSDQPALNRLSDKILIGHSYSLLKTSITLANFSLIDQL